MCLDACQSLAQSTRFTLHGTRGIALKDTIGHKSSFNINIYAQIKGDSRHQAFPYSEQTQAFSLQHGSLCLVS